MVLRWGMSEKLGPRVFGHKHGQPFLGRDVAGVPSYSKALAREIDDEIRCLVDLAQRRASELLLTHRARLTTMSEALLRHETIDRLQFLALLAGKPASEVFADVHTRGKTRADRPERCTRSVVPANGGQSTSSADSSRASCGRARGHLHPRPHGGWATVPTRCLHVPFGYLDPIATFSRHRALRSRMRSCRGRHGDPPRSGRLRRVAGPPGAPWLPRSGAARTR